MIEEHRRSIKPPLLISDAAKQHLLAALAQQPLCIGARVAVRQKGCSGYAYVIDYIQEKSESDCVLPLNDRYVLCLDMKSLPYLQGSTMDYVKQGLNARLVFENPNQTGQCGCGESFTVD